MASTPESLLDMMSEGDRMAIEWLDANIPIHSCVANATNIGTTESKPTSSLPQEASIHRSDPPKASPETYNQHDLTTLNRKRAQVMKAKMRRSRDATLLEAQYNVMFASYNLIVLKARKELEIVVKESHKYIFDALEFPSSWDTEKINLFRQEFNAVANEPIWPPGLLCDALDKNASGPEGQVPTTPRGCLFSQLNQCAGIFYKFKKGVLVKARCVGCPRLKQSFCVHLRYAEGVSDPHDRGMDGKTGSRKLVEDGPFANQQGRRWIVGERL